MIGRIDAALANLRFRGIDCYSSWLGRGDGPYIVARKPLWIKSNPNLAYEFIVPLDDGAFDKFLDFIEEKLNSHPDNEEPHTGKEGR